MQTDMHFWSHLAQFFLEWEMLQTKVVQETKTHIYVKYFFFNRAIYEICERNMAEQNRTRVRIILRKHIELFFN
jgi:hypothetical protein